MKNFFDYLQYLGLKFFVKALAIMPENFILKFGEIIGLILTKVMPNRYKRSINDIQKVFPDKTLKECREIAQKSWVNMGRIVAEFAKATKLTKDQILNKVRFENCEEFFEANAKGKGGIVLLGHFANWEVLGLAGAIKAKKIAFIAYPQNNRYVDEYLGKLRGVFGNTLISSHSPFFAACRALKRGSLVGILADQSVGSSKLYMNFLNRPAEVSPLAAVLSLKTGTPVYCVSIHREGKQTVAHYEGTVNPPDVPYSTKAVYDLTKILKTKLEENVLKYPADWLWAHNRWKREQDARRAMEREQLHGH